MLKLSLRTKLTLYFSIVIIVGVSLSAVVGIHLIGNTIIRQAQDKVRLDLNSAREVYLEEADNIKTIVRLSALRYFVRDALIAGDYKRLQEELSRIKEQEGLDILNVTYGSDLAILLSDTIETETYAHDEIMQAVRTTGAAVVATQIMPAEVLLHTSEALTEQARIVFVPTPKARARPETELTAGMVIKAAAPVFDQNGTIIGILTGGTLLNRNFQIVDKVKDIVYRAEQYKGRDIGTATIFQDDLRISTNVYANDGSRAIGTRVSEEVYERVVVKGEPWIRRAFVVNAWYITAYEPIRDLHGSIIGMLYVGMLEAPYVDLQSRVVVTFVGIAVISVLLLSVIAYVSTTRITQPMHELLHATRRIAQGELDYRVNTKSTDEIGQLAHSFNHMTDELQKATEGYRTLTKTLEDKVKTKTDELVSTQNQLIQYEKLTAIGKLAAGIAHEINNPLTSILLNSHLIAEKMGRSSTLQDNVKMIIDETTRCGTIVKGLLQFSRQSVPEKRPAQINDIINDTLLLFESQILVSNVRVVKSLSDGLPLVMVDTNKIKQVFTNLLLNALDAMPKGGVLTIASSITDDKAHVEVSFADTGRGITAEQKGRIFDPFFTTKGMKGTGLGLSVSYGIIEQHSGTITVESEVGAGTEFTIHLPVKGNETKDKEVFDE
jgi:two-component system NtrC family sensor kinase